MHKQSFECYSNRLVEFLMENGLMFKRMDIHKRTGKTMWIFDNNERLSKLLTIWTNKENLQK